MPERKWMRHDRPGWVDDEDPVFLTLCGQVRGLNQFAQEGPWELVVRAAERLRSRQRWSPLLLLAMPDHLHLIARIPSRVGIPALVRSFKHDVSYKRDIRWQQGVFDHRIRNDDSYRAKWMYVLHNPVRAGLVQVADEWPYVKIWA